MRIADPVFQKPHQVVMADMVNEAFDVGLHHPLGLLVGDDLSHPTQRAEGTSTRAKTIGAGAECRFLDRLQNLA
jgi:hypothetical protein